MSSSQTVMQLHGEVRRWARAPASPVPPAPEPAGEAVADAPTLFMVGNSPVMFDVFEQVRRFAACDVPVLITGESGTGKELVARAIHERSGRAAGPYVALNCAAVPATLIASELFGYEKGSFTGANARKHGHIEHAHRGTLFLDEIGDMPIDLQGLLLRFLQEGEILRVGGRQPIKVDVRVVAATNVRLREAIAAGKLREDLYYRLNVLSLHLPPLRERDGDVEVLATYFLRQIGQELGRELRGFTPAALAAMLAYPWPGNVRELIATMRRAVVLANGPLVDVSDLRLDPVPTAAAVAGASGGAADPAADRVPAKARQRRRARGHPAGVAGEQLQHDPRGPAARRRPRHPVPHAGAQPDRARPALSGAAARAGGGDMSPVRGAMAQRAAAAGQCCTADRGLRPHAGGAGQRIAASRSADTHNRLAVRRGNCLTSRRCRRTTLTNRCQAIENASIFPAIRQAFCWHADCWSSRGRHANRQGNLRRQIAPSRGPGSARAGMLQRPPQGRGKEEERAL